MRRAVTNGCSDPMERDSFLCTEIGWIACKRPTSAPIPTPVIFQWKRGYSVLSNSAQRYEYGTINASLIAGLGAALSFWQTIGADAIWRRNRELTYRLAEGLHSLGAQVLTTTRSASILSFGIPGVHYADVQSYLWNDHRIRLRGIYEGETQRSPRLNSPV